MADEAEQMFSTSERVATGYLITLVLVLGGGSVLLPGPIVDAFLDPYVLDPIAADAGVEGDESYNNVNTVLYAVTLLACVVSFPAFFRRWGLPADDRMLMALLAWVCLAPVLRVLEDADFFDPSYEQLFISPVIHLHLAGWLILVAIASTLCARFPWLTRIERRGAPTPAVVRGFMQQVTFGRMIAVLTLLLVVQWSLLYAPSEGAHDVPSWIWARIGMGLSPIILFILVMLTASWHPVSRGLLAYASASIVLGSGYLMQFWVHPWVQDNGYMPTPNGAWPFLLVLIPPALVCLALSRIGTTERRHLHALGYEPGVVPDGWDLRSWETDEDAKLHPVHRMSPRAQLGSPMVLAMVYGQICDGFATFTGVDLFGYSEKHVVSYRVIEWGQAILAWVTGAEFVPGVTEPTVVPGAWFFTLVKAGLVGLVAYLFSIIYIERRQEHLRILIVLAVLIVGLAPGLRDVGRLALGV